ncbi:FAD-binding oxidoreductase [Sulfitobacter sp. 20_GPM-1509m]|uniref:NAD(P)/FAD-dependent oxidoreductase n=1 Tax=Sulfitobacter sp. 20_GPM-1509m TaxID=1380367 RepID=UPI00049089E5|nr:FAD-dependent oxidoreductase [Sulfitobacter sp. 20_GPM-1509m]
MSNNGNSTEVEFTVIGGGVVGLSIAYGLLREGKTVRILDEGDLDFRASRGNFALVWLQSKGFGLSDYSVWTQRSISLWPTLSNALLQETGIDVGLSQKGGFLLYLDEDGLEQHVNRLTILNQDLANHRIPFTQMDNGELQKMLPGLGPDVVGGTYCPLDGHVNALRLFNALHKACVNRGVDYVPNASVTKLARANGEYVIETLKGTFGTPKVVLAAGLGNAKLAPMIGLKAPLSPQRGQIIVTEKLDKFLDYPIGTIRQTDEGSVLIGASKEDAGFDVSTSSNVMSDLAAEAVKMFPVLARARIVRAWGSLRVMCPDGFPLYDEDSSTHDAFLVTCHSGVTLSAAHALELTKEIAGGKLSDQSRKFGPQRFENV